MANAPVAPEFLAGGGEMGQRIREFDWESTSLGPVHTWPQSLRTCIRIMLTSSQPIWIGWGKELIKFYNDPYKAIVGGKHPWALGSPASVVWKDIWRDIEPMLKTVMDEDTGTYVESQLLIMERNGYPEETYYTFSYTPIPGDNGGTEGMICFNTDDTYRILSERQLQTVTELSKDLIDAKTDEEVIGATLQSLQHNTHDFPFVLFYTYGTDKAILSGTANVAGSNMLVPTEINLSDDSSFSAAINTAASTKKLQFFSDIQPVFGSHLPTGAWQVPATKVIILPVVQASNKDPYGFLIFGFNPYRLLDENYSNFFSQVSDQVATSFANVHMLEEERKRAEALAEIDRAKTIFFSNISHEFRTPLTLIMGPIEDVLNDPATKPINKQRMQLASRNALRMQKLVNTLLDFSRIEAGRVDGRYSRVDIAALTQDLASTFRSAIEKAGMQLVFDVMNIAADVYVDTDMWEKIMLNLLSNAFKYSKQGEIRVAIKQSGNAVEVSVTDTGIGIDETQLDKIFNRFHRVENSEGRSQEGTGIGLAMVKELVKLHNGTITVQSKPGKGSTFTITIPAGRQHLPADKVIEEQPVNSTVSKTSAAFLQEALKWLPGEEEPINISNKNIIGIPQNKQNSNEVKILLADDNADMRDYVSRLLQSQYTVITAVNGEDAYAKMLEHKPALLLSDVMMPKFDGFELLKRVRNHPDIKNTPIIFLSARAGNEAMVEGLDAGADDYMVKPFSAKELITRVTNLVRINQVRRETEQQFYQLFLQTPAIINVFKGPNHVYELFHPKNKELFGDVDFTGMPMREAIPDLEGQNVVEVLDEVYNKGITIRHNERLVYLTNGKGEKLPHYFNSFFQPWYNIRGEIQGVFGFSTEVTETVMARKKIEQSEQRFRTLVMQAPVSIAVLMGDEFMVEIANDNYLALVGKNREDFVGKSLWEALPEIKTQVYVDILNNVMASGDAYYGYESEVFLIRNSIPETIYVNFIYSPLKDVDEKPIGIMAVAIDVTPQVMARKKLEESEQSLIEMANAIPQLAWVADAAGEIEYYNNRITGFTGTTKNHKGLPEWEGLLHPDDKDYTAKAWDKAVKHSSTFEAEHRMRMRDGSYHWHLSRGVPQRDEEGNVLKWFGTATDINDAKEQKTILEEEVKKRTQELRALNISLQKSNDDLQQFAHVASHDLKEPVRKIKTFAGRIQDEYNELLPEKGRVYLNKVQQATQRMYTMIDGVLNYSAVNSSEENISQVDLNEVIKNIETDLEIAIQQKNAVIKKSELPVLQGAPVLLYQLFYNLINNSLKFAKPDVPAVIKVTGNIENTDGTAKAIITVEDNGIGFEQNYAASIFNTFTRLNAKDLYEGTGLGLALCKKIAERHNGSIIAQGEKNIGAIFTLTLPLQQQEKYI